MQTKPHNNQTNLINHGLVASYDTWPGNGSSCLMSAGVPCKIWMCKFSQINFLWTTVNSENWWHHSEIISKYVKQLSKKHIDFLLSWLADVYLASSCSQSLGYATVRIHTHSTSWSLNTTIGRILAHETPESNYNTETGSRHSMDALTLVGSNVDKIKCTMLIIQQLYLPKQSKVFLVQAYTISQLM